MRLKVALYSYSTVKYRSEHEKSEQSGVSRFFMLNNSYDKRYDNHFFNCKL